MKRAALVFALTILAGCAQHQAAGSSSASSTAAPSSAPDVAKVGELAPAFSEPQVGGAPLAMSDLKGKAVYLNFFATWCPPCNEEAPAIDALQHAYAKDGLQVVGVDVLENPQKAQQFMTEHHLSYPAIVDSGTLRNAYRLNGLPLHVFIDRQGIVRAIVEGELQPSDMRSHVQAILGHS
jgi:peroxiredoxin